MKYRFGNAATVMAIMAMIGWLFVNEAFATALSGARNTPEKDFGKSISLTMASNVIIYAGSIVCVDSNGKANPAADSSGFAVAGRASETVDNRTAVYSATAKVRVDKGIFRWVNGDVIAIADIGKLVYITDDQTVNKTGGGQNIIAGTVYDVDSSGVWVDTGKVGPSGAATPSSLSVSGAATVGTTLTVTGASTLTGAATLGSTLVVTGAVTGVAAVNAGTVLTSYNYDAIVSTNKSGQVFAWQPFSFVATGAEDTTNTFNPAFIATPLYYNYRITGGVYVNTNAMTMTTGSVIIAMPPTSGVGAVYGRIK